MKSKRCNICGRKLTNPVSIIREMGPICYKKYVRKHGSVKKTTASSTETCQRTLL